MYMGDLAAIRASMETKASVSNPRNDTPSGEWLRIALAAEALAGASTSANESIHGYMRRAVIALESLSATSGAEETDTYYGLLKRFVDALEVKAGAVGTSSLEDRAKTAAANAVFFNPASLFGGGDQGAVYDFTTMSSLFQTTDTSTPVTTTGQPVGRANDLSGKNNHLLQATAGLRPLFQNNLLLDGADDNMATNAITLNATDKATVIVSASASATGVQHLFGTSVNSRFFTRLAGAPLAATAALINTGTSELSANTTETLNAPAVLGFLFDMAGATATDEVVIRRNGAVVANTIVQAGPAGVGNLGNSQLIMGTYGGGAYAGSIWRAIIINRLLTAGELLNAERWAGAPAGVVL
jgi:hypothetical protein